MSDQVVIVRDLSKRYRIGEKLDRYLTLRQTLSDNARNLVRRPSRRPATVVQDIWALKNVSFEISHGDVLGIIGRNGAGKTTMLRILSRITEPTSGHAAVRGRLGSLLEVGTGFHPELTGRENTFLNGAILGMDRSTIKRRFDEIIAFAEIEDFVDTPVKRYSSGMYLRLAFSVAAHLEPDVLVVDEVLAVGDAAFQQRCIGRMNEVAHEGRTVLFVSHNMTAVAHLCTLGMVLDRGRCTFFGSASDAIARYHADLLPSGGGSKEHVVFERPIRDGIAITKVELLSKSGESLPHPRTWDPVTFRIHYQSDRQVNRGSVALRIRTLEGARLLLLATEPDTNFPLKIEPGKHAVDCHVERFPLAAGTYSIGGGIAIPFVEWLWRDDGFSTMQVWPADVYGTGIAPEAHRAAVAIPYRWQQVD